MLCKFLGELSLQNKNPIETKGTKKEYHMSQEIARGRVLRTVRKKPLTFLLFPDVFGNLPAVFRYDKEKEKIYEVRDNNEDKTNHAHGCILQ